MVENEGQIHAAEDGAAGIPNSAAVKEGLLGVGQMATLNCVSEQTLRMYQRKGIIEPRLVDSETGYRYYSLDQSTILDAVTQLKALGFSLDEIQEVLEEGDVRLLKPRLERHLAELRGRRRSLQMAESFAASLIDACDLCLHKPPCGQLLWETMPERYGLSFIVDPMTPPDPGNADWERVVRDVKAALYERGYPPALFQKVSGVIAKEDLLNGTLATRRAVIFVRPDLVPILGDDLVVIPGGLYLTMYFENALLDNNLSPEYPAIRSMLAQAESLGYEVAGDYIGETLADTPAFAYHGVNTFLKCELPVRRRTAEKTL